MSADEDKREPSLADQVYDRLVREILDGVHPVNSRLPSESVLSQSFGVSRPILRAAISRLNDDGLVGSRRGSGHYVIRRPDRSVVDFIPLASITDIQRCYEFRIDIESAAAAWAAQRRDQSDIDRLEEGHKRMAEAYAAKALGVDIDHEFHHNIARATKNAFYISVLESLSSQIQFAMRLSRSLTLQAAPARNELVQAEHRALLDAIIAQDAEAAREAMRKHLTGARNRMFDGGDSTSD